jgi:hypothetical protein
VSNRGFALLAIFTVVLAACSGSGRAARHVTTPTAATAPFTTTIRPFPPSPANPPAPGPLVTNGRAWSGHGELAFVSRDQLYVLDDAGRFTTVSGPAGGGGYGSPAWSPDGSWLAFSYSVPPPAAFGGPSSTDLYVLRAGSSTAQEVGTSSDIGQFAWAPTGGPVLAFETTDPGSLHTSLWTDLPGRLPRQLPGLSLMPGGFAWSPDATHLAVVTGHRGNGQGVGPLSVLQVIPLTGGPAVTWHQSTQDGIDIAGWWPNGGGLLFWIDTDYSASVAADGLNLYSEAVGGDAILLANTLVNTSWLTWNPQGTTLALVAGGSRIIWNGDKEVETCDPVTAACTPVKTPTGTVGLDPSWSPSGLSYIDASASGPFKNGIAYFSEAWLNEWDQTRSLVGVAPPGGRQMSLRHGVDAAQWARDGRFLLLAQDDYLSVGPANGRGQVRVAGPLFDTVAPSGYYGQVPWQSTFAWHQR